MPIDESGRYDPLDRLAEEFAARFRRGERPSLEEYTDRYPDLADEIRERFPASATVERAEEICQVREEAEQISLGGRGDPARRRVPRRPIRPMIARSAGDGRRIATTAEKRFAPAMSRNGPAAQVQL